MLKIDIVGNSGNNLLLEVNGVPNQGLSNSFKDEVVQWKVKNGSGVKNILAINMKSITGNIDIFSKIPPACNDTEGNDWQAKVNYSAEPGDVFIYNIEWQKEGEETNRVYDPIISIRPR